ncbi:MAG: GTPase HflX [Treponema sp.]|jgi:GTP-binding protein HflX|nr:GTPase HflX [Treponema sp.]
MKPLQETGEAARRAFLIGIRDDKTGREEAESLTTELASLASTLGVEIVGKETVHLRETHPQYGMGTGKAQELADRAADSGADCLIFDRTLSPSQQRNWERLTGIAAVDREELIIQIFASRAATREAELQVELASLTYSLPRLSHKYIDLARQRGGRYGAKGAGETKYETDRRQVEQRIHRIKQELVEVRKHRATQRKQRERIPLPACALVGYTNAGKSSLLNAMTNAEVLVEDTLFATLDPTTRRLEMEGRPILLTDTVGFIRRLPHNLVDAFRATLEEVSRADILIHVLDASDPDIDRYFETTLGVLRDLGADHTPIITALNKCDRLTSPEALEQLHKRYGDAVCISTRERTGLPELALRIDLLLSGDALTFRFPADRHDLVALLYRSSTVLSERYEAETIIIEARTGERIRELLQAYRCPTPAPSP